MYGLDMDKYIQNDEIGTCTEGHFLLKYILLMAVRNVEREKERECVCERRTKRERERTKEKE